MKTAHTNINDFLAETATGSLDVKIVWGRYIATLYTQYAHKHVTAEGPTRAAALAALSAALADIEAIA